MQELLESTLRSLGQALATAILLAISLVITALATKKKGKPFEHWFRKPSRPIETTHEDDVQITLILDRTRIALGAKRVYLSKFHNGDHFDDDSDIRRKSRTHEVVEDGGSYQTEEFRGMLTSTVPDETSLVMQPGPSFKRVADLPHGKFRWLCERGGAKSVARAAIRKGNNVIGFVGADFNSDQEPANINLLVSAAEDIGQLLAIT